MNLTSSDTRMTIRRNMLKLREFREGPGHEMSTFPTDTCIIMTLRRTHSTKDDERCEQFLIQLFERHTRICGTVLSRQSHLSFVDNPNVTRDLLGHA